MTVTDKQMLCFHDIVWKRAKNVQEEVLLIKI